MPISSIAAQSQAMSAAQLQLEFATRVAGMQKEFIEDQGELALQLIQAANIDPMVGQNLDVSA